MMCLPKCAVAQTSSLRSEEHLYNSILLTQVGGKGSHEKTSDHSVILLRDVLCEDRKDGKRLSFLLPFYLLLLHLTMHGY